MRAKQTQRSMSHNLVNISDSHACRHRFKHKLKNEANFGAQPNIGVYMYTNTCIHSWLRHSSVDITRTMYFYVLNVSKSTRAVYRNETNGNYYYTIGLMKIIRIATHTYTHAYTTNITLCSLFWSDWQWNWILLVSRVTHIQRSLARIISRTNLLVSVHQNSLYYLATTPLFVFLHALNASKHIVLRSTQIRTGQQNSWTKEDIHNRKGSTFFCKYRLWTSKYGFNDWDRRGIYAVFTTGYDGIVLILGGFERVSRRLVDFMRNFSLTMAAENLIVLRVRMHRFEQKLRIHPFCSILGVHCFDENLEYTVFFGQYWDFGQVW